MSADAAVSGLHTAYELSKQGITVKVIEARGRLGGRIYSPYIHDGTGFDLGPSWFWPQQPCVESLVNELGLKNQIFQQYSHGDGLFETNMGSLQRGHGGFSMEGSLRISGGFSKLVESVEAVITKNAGQSAIVLNSFVSTVVLTNKGLMVVTPGEKFIFERVVIAAPPRVVVRDIAFEPKLSSERITELNSMATWMASHAKAVMIYDRPFWREQGLSGDVISHLGPLSELHDASADGTGHYALFGFFGTPVSQRTSHSLNIEEAIRVQLKRLFGEHSPEPRLVLFKDWATDAQTSTELDWQTPHQHNRIHLSNHLEIGWNGRLIWSGTESDTSAYNGYIEGALNASWKTLEMLGR